MKVYIQLSYEKAAAWKRLWITHELSTKFKLPATQKLCRVETWAEAFIMLSRHLSATIYQGFHLSRAASIAKVKYTYTDLYTENVTEPTKEYCWMLNWNAFRANKLWETRQTVLDDRSWKHWRLGYERDSLVVPSALLMCLTALGVQSACLVGNNIMYRKACLDREKLCSF